MSPQLAFFLGTCFTNLLYVAAYYIFGVPGCV